MTADTPTTSPVTSEINVRVLKSDDTHILPKDPHDSSIWAICHLSDGMFLIVDHGNDKLKRIDSAYQLVDAIVLENIRDVCEVRPGQAAVAMFSRLCGVIQLIEIGMSMSTTHSFTTDTVCRSLTFAADRFFVCHTNYVSAYSLKGALLSTIKHDQRNQNLFTSLWHISRTSDNRMLYVCDDKKGLVVIDTSGSVLKSINTSDNKLVPRGVCVTSIGHVLLCDRDDNSVLHLPPKGWKLKTIFEKDTTLEKPRVVCYDDKNEKLLVACTRIANKILLFDLDKTIKEELSRR